MIELDPNSIEDGLEILFRRLFEHELKAKDVSLMVEFVKDGETSGKNITLTPRRAGSAPIGAFCENGGEIIYLTVGQNTPLEVPVSGQRYTQFANAEELIALVQAVAAGRMEETIWTREANIVKSVGKIFVDNDRPITIKSSTLSNPFVSLKKKEYKYLPYSR